MNKYNIKVGDSYTTIRGSRFYFCRVTDNEVGVGRDANPEKEITSWTIAEFTKMIDEGIKILDKPVSKGKIIGYKLLKDSISAKKGEIYKVEEGVIRRYKGAKSYVITQEEANQPEWFSPIYEEVKPSEVYVNTSVGKVKVSKVGMSLSVGEYLPMPQVIKVFKEIGVFHDSMMMKVGTYGVSIETFKVGCKTFHVSDIKPLQEAIKQVS